MKQDKTRVLRLHTSLFQENSVSSQLVEELTRSMIESGANLDTMDRDFRLDPIPHLDGERLQALSTGVEDRTAEQQAVVDYADQLTAEVQTADVLIIALPMYNFSVPSMFKAWYDHIARAGVTFSYTEEGPVGLLKGKKAYLVSAMGGIHEQGQTDFLQPYVELLMNFIGISDVEFVSAQGLAMGDSVRERALTSARASIVQIAGQTSKQHPPTAEVAA